MCACVCACVCVCVCVRVRVCLCVVTIGTIVIIHIQDPMFCDWCAGGVGWGGVWVWLHQTSGPGHCVEDTLLLDEFVGRVKFHYPASIQYHHPGEEEEH